MSLVFRLSILALVSTAFAADSPANNKSFVCNIDNITAFELNKASDKWEGVVGGFQNSTLLVRPVKADDLTSMGRLVTSEKYGIWRVGDEFPFLMCNEGIDTSNWLRCGGDFGRQFVFNALTLRYVMTHHGDYMIATSDFDGSFPKDKDGDPVYAAAFMGIGSCSEL